MSRSSTIPFYPEIIMIHLVSILHLRCCFLVSMKHQSWTPSPTPSLPAYQLTRDTRISENEKMKRASITDEASKTNLKTRIDSSRSIPLSRVVGQLPPLRSLVRRIHWRRAARLPRQLRRPGLSRHLDSGVPSIHLQIRPPAVARHLVLPGDRDGWTRRHDGEGLSLPAG